MNCYHLSEYNIYSSLFAIMASGMHQSIRKGELMGEMGLQVQMVLFWSVILFMVVKKQFDSVPRTWWIWWLDCNKQGTAAVFTHMLNVYVAVLISQTLPPMASSDQCTWYLITYLNEVLLGTFLSFLLLKLLDACFIRHGFQSLASGNYYFVRTVYKTIKLSPGQSIPHGCSEETIIDYKLYLLQCLIWIFVLTVSKSLLVLLQLQLSQIS